MLAKNIFFLSHTALYTAKNVQIYQMLQQKLIFNICTSYLFNYLTFINEIFLLLAI